MKVKCIDAGYVSLTFGKEYNVTKVSGDGKHYYVVGDDNEDFAYPARSFSLQAETNLPPLSGEYKESVEKMLDNFSGKSAKQITYKDFLAAMPKDSLATVMFSEEVVNIYAYDLEFCCTTEERAEEVYAALITLFKEP